MWIVWSILSTGIIACMLIPSRVLGLTWVSYSVIIILECGFVAWMIPLAMKSAPSYFQYWFMNTALLGMFGVAISMMYFRETITITNAMGAILTAAGAILLAL